MFVRSTRNLLLKYLENRLTLDLESTNFIRAFIPTLSTATPDMTSLSTSGRKLWGKRSKMPPPMIERLVVVRIHHHIIQSPNYNILQSDYQKHHSTETALNFFALLRILSPMKTSTLVVALRLCPGPFSCIRHCRTCNSPIRRVP